MSISGRPRVVIADDYPPMVAALERLFSLTCDIVGSVADTVSVVEMVKRLQPDVVLLDLNLADGSSLAACREIISTTPKAKVIVLTGGSDSSLRPHVLAAGASAFVLKTAVSADLLEAIALADRS